jgi:hypothetical protein
MHKKLASDLTSLAHSILQMKNKDDVHALKQKAYEVYEKLSVLAYVEEYINTTPNAEVSKEELLEKIALAEAQKETENQQQEEIFVEVDIVEESVEVTQNLVEETIIEEPKESAKVEEITEQPFDELEGLLFNDPQHKDEAQFIEETKTPTLEDELKDTISVDVMADLFQKVEPKKTVNDQTQDTIQIGLNDRIAFVKNLFDGNQEDFNRVISQLNTFNTEKEAKKFISKMVKPDYDWTEKEEYETRLIEIIERRFA